MTSVLFDTNIVLDVLLERQPFYSDSACILDMACRGEIKGFVAGHAVTTIFYICHKINPRDIRASLTRLMDKIAVAPINDTVIASALKSHLADFEDAVTLAAGVEVGAETIISRNIPDFGKSSLKIVLPRVFLDNPANR